MDAFDAPILTDEITVDHTGIDIEWNLDVHEYESFAFHNIGKKDIEIILVPNEQVIKVISGMIITVEQNTVQKVTIRARNEDETSKVFYAFQGWTL